MVDFQLSCLITSGYVNSIKCKHCPNGRTYSNKQVELWMMSLMSWKQGSSWSHILTYGSYHHGYIDYKMILQGLHGCLSEGFEASVDNLQSLNHPRDHTACCLPPVTPPVDHESDDIGSESDHWRCSSTMMRVSSQSSFSFESRLHGLATACLQQTSMKQLFTSQVSFKNRKCFWCKLAGTLAATGIVTLG